MSTTTNGIEPLTMTKKACQRNVKETKPTSFEYVTRRTKIALVNCNQWS